MADGMDAQAGHVLIVDDDHEMCRMLAMLLERKGFEAVSAHDGNTAIESLTRVEPDVVLLDVRLPGPDGMVVLRHARSLYPGLPILIITGYAGVDGAVEALKAGAYDYLPKPFDNSQVAQAVSCAMAERPRARRVDNLPKAVQGSERLRRLMGPSGTVERLAADVVRVANTDFSVVILGETGTGKELVADVIHQSSRHAEGPFVAVDCGAIPEDLLENELFGHEKGSYTGADERQAGKFEAAQGGTLFLDEIANMPLASQAKLLRVLQERRFFRVGGTEAIRVDARVVAASNEDLRQAHAAGRFRQDLLYRLNEFPIRIPPLRERREDIPYLAERFLAETAGELEKTLPALTEAAQRRLQAFDWPGNVRELRSAVRRAALLAEDRIDEEHLQLGGGGPADVPRSDCEEALSPDGRSLKEILRGRMQEMEHEILRQALEQTGGNKAAVARLLKVDYKTAHSKLNKFGITTEG